MPEPLTPFELWTRKREVSCIGTNAGSATLPFQRWKHFKEAFVPELIARACSSSDRKVRRCLDPFGGSGTTALACQFLGVHPTTVEVNPYLADLIEAKLTTYSGNLLAREFGRILATSQSEDNRRCGKLDFLPKTFVEPGVKGRWIFSRAALDELLRLTRAIDRIDSESNRRLFRVLLGGILTTVSNIRVSGKGRRYRSNWQQNPRSAIDVRKAFIESCHDAIAEIHAYRQRPELRYDLRRGDARETTSSINNIDLVVFSPPYPNSFDYTDVYNLELWLLGYLDSFEANRRLRHSTLCSHVQVRRSFSPPPTSSKKLRKTLEALRNQRKQLWSSHLPEMVGGYFTDLQIILQSLKSGLNEKAQIWMVVGDSQYASIRIETASILKEIAIGMGYKLCFTEPFRSMRSSPQQGGMEDLPETLLVLRLSSSA